MLKRFPLYLQLDAKDCGPTCLRMVAKYYGRDYSLQTLRERSYITRSGVTMLGISDAAEAIGFRTTGVRLTFDRLVDTPPVPCILHWNQHHFVVCYAIKKSRKGVRIYISDPASERLVYTEKEFKHCWLGEGAGEHEKGYALLLEPGPAFYDDEEYAKASGDGGERQSLAFFARYLRPHRQSLGLLLLGMVTVSLLGLIAPFLTQAMVDIGIGGRSMDIITLVLLAQLMVFVSQFTVSLIRSWVTLHMNARINIALISDFLSKLMRLPLRFFDSRLVGDITQRIHDHSRIETFLTGSSVGTLFSSVNFVIYAIVLAYYNATLLVVFLVGNGLYVAWIQLFMRYRRKLDFKRFNQASEEQSNLYQLITGMPEIKLNNCETQKRWQWENIQVRLFRTSVKSLTVGQYQRIGGAFFTQLTHIAITYIAAREVVRGNITLGMMMSLSYIIGQLSGPISELSSFLTSLQYAKISLERLSEVHGRQDEEETRQMKRKELPPDRSIRIEHLTFSYSGAERHNVLHDINLELPARKVTALVGASGCEKTTLIKLLLGFYEPTQGSVKVGGVPLNLLSVKLWRSKVGCVMQDGFLFSDDIAHNIAVGVDEIDRQRLDEAARQACISEFIDGLPFGYNTQIGMEGTGISQGQRQRLLIARAIYKDPEYIFLDEATNSLDANNEKAIMRNLEQFYQGRTVVVAAHRLSTVKHADNIVVMDKGRVMEQGTHEELLARRGRYYELVKNQLEA